MWRYFITTGAQCRELYLGLSDFYRQQANLTGSANDAGLAQGCRKRAEYCALD